MDGTSVSEGRAVPVTKGGVSDGDVSFFKKWGFKRVYSALAGALPFRDPVIILLQMGVNEQ